MHVAVLTVVCAVGLVLVHILVLGILLVIEQRSVRAVETLWRECAVDGWMQEVHSQMWGSGPVRPVQAA